MYDRRRDMNNKFVGHDGETIPCTMDGQVWAKEFMASVMRNPRLVVDEDVMLGWFANAIMAGYDAARRVPFGYLHVWGEKRK